MDLQVYTLIVCCTSWHLKIVPIVSIMRRLILSIFVVYGESFDLAIVRVLGTCSYEHLYCTDVYIVVSFF